ncbi:hypothetical protein [Scytonema hofmannii]|nr:hypothetical protein [Scytonema hofmannii]
MILMEVGVASLEETMVVASLAAVGVVTLEETIVAVAILGVE